MFRRNSRFDFFDPYDMADIFGYSGSRYSLDGDVDRRSFAAVSDRAMRAQNEAKKIFLDHLATVDISGGAVTTEIIKFHLVPDMKKGFNKFVKEYGCTATSRKITREEQDKINKSRQSLMQFTSVKVTPAAQRAYLEKNPQLKKSQAAASTSAAASVPAATATTNKKRSATAAGLESTSSSASAAKKAKA